MKRLKIMKSYAVLWLFIYFLVYSNLEAMATFFFATLTFNLAVLTILTIGIIVILKSSINLVMLAGTFGTLAYKKDNIAFYLQGIDKIMPANIAHMFHARAEKGVLLFTSEESRTVVEWIDEKFSHQNRYINYFISTSLMIGLLGTFTGLLVSIDQMGKIILSLTGDIDLGEVIRSFAGPLGGMATGFGSSLFGVISAIILGIMGYILNKNQELLVEGVEDWLKGRIIDSGGATSSVVTTAAAPGVASESALPEQRASFMDVFIDNIASLTKEMAKVSLTNERLHSITIASVQQARDEHEVNYELFESMSSSLSTIVSSTQESSSMLEEKLSSLQERTLTTQKETHQELKEQLEAINSRLLSSQEISANSLESLLASLATLSQKIEAESLLLGSLERLNTQQIDDINIQTTAIESLKDRSQIASKIEALEELLKLEQRAQEKRELTQESIALRHEELLKANLLNQDKGLSAQESTQLLLEKQRAILELLVGKNSDDIRELKRVDALDIEDTKSKPRGFFSKLFS